jgi:hypothetical protein
MFRIVIYPIIRITSQGLDVVDDPGMIPRGPSDWGSLIWQEPWADRGWKEKESEWFLFSGLAYLSGITGIVIVIAVLTGNPWREYLLLILLFLVFVSGFAVSFGTIRYRLPIRVYEEGFTFYPNIIWWYNVTEKDHFIPYDNVIRITVEKSRYRDWHVVRIIIELVNGSSLSGNLSIMKSSVPLYIKAIRDQNQEIQFEGLHHLDNPFKK